MSQVPSQKLGSKRKRRHRAAYLAAAAVVGLGLVGIFSAEGLGVRHPVESAEGKVAGTDQNTPASPSASSGSASPSDTAASGTPSPGAETGGSPSAPATPSVRTEGWSAEAAELPPPARDAVISFIDTAAAMSVVPTPAEAKAEAAVPQAPDYSAIATGSALGELTAQFEEFQDNKWTLRGIPELTVRGVESLEVAGAAVRRVSICVDSSALELKDQDGRILVPAAGPGTRTALNYYDLQEQDGSWLVVSHSFPDNPNC